MAKRGRPKSIAQQETAQLDTNVELVPNVSMESGLISDDLRDAQYDEYEKYRLEHTGDATEVSEVIPEASPTAVSEAEPEKPASEVVEDVTEPEPEKQATTKEEYVAEVKKPQIEEKPDKTVPLAALHEARNENKELKRRLQELEQRANQIPSEDTPDDYEYVTKQEFKSVAEKLAMQEYEVKKNIFNRQIEETDLALKAKKIYGFKELGRLVVEKEINEMYLVDPEWAISNDTPQGWEMIWEKKYPDYKRMFVAQDMSATMEAKEQRKQGAGMVGNPGLNAKVPETTKRPQTREEAYAEYIAERKAGRL